MAVYNVAVTVIQNIEAESLADAAERLTKTLKGLGFSPVECAPDGFRAHPDIEADALHHFEAFDGSSGMVCTAMVTSPDGSGDSCGRPASDAIHVR